MYKDYSIYNNFEVIFQFLHSLSCKDIATSIGFYIREYMALDGLTPAEVAINLLRPRI